MDAQWDAAMSGAVDAGALAQSEVDQLSDSIVMVAASEQEALQAKQLTQLRSGGLPGMLAEGQHVRVQGIRARESLNGSLAWVLAFDPGRGRYAVDCIIYAHGSLPTCERLLLRRSNMVAASTGSGRSLTRAPLRAGCLVEVLGLVGRPELNGCVGEVEGNLSSSGRFAVRIIHPTPLDEVIGIKPANLQGVLAQRTGALLEPDARSLYARLQGNWDLVDLVTGIAGLRALGALQCTSRDFSEGCIAQLTARAHALNAREAASIERADDIADPNFFRVLTLASTEELRQGLRLVYLPPRIVERATASELLAIFKQCAAAAHGNLLIGPPCTLSDGYEADSCAAAGFYRVSALAREHPAQYRTFCEGGGLAAAVRVLRAIPSYNNEYTLVKSMALGVMMITDAGAQGGPMLIAAAGAVEATCELVASFGTRLKNKTRDFVHEIINSNKVLGPALVTLANYTLSSQRRPPLLVEHDQCLVDVNSDGDGLVAHVCRVVELQLAAEEQLSHQPRGPGGDFLLQAAVTLLANLSSEGIATSAVLAQLFEHGAPAVVRMLHLPRIRNDCTIIHHAARLFVNLTQQNIEVGGCDAHRPKKAAATLIACGVHVALVEAMLSLSGAHVGGTCATAGQFSPTDAIQSAKIVLGRCVLTQPALFDELSKRGASSEWLS